MTTLPDSVAWYDAHAGAQAAAYEAIDPARLHGWLTGLLPTAPALILDVGAGSVPGPVNSPPKADRNRHLRPEVIATLVPEAPSRRRGRSAADG